MPFQIAGGNGGTYTAHVNSDGKLEVAAITREEDAQATLEGDSYNVNTGIIDLTDAVDTPVLYLKNNETRGLHVKAIAVGIEYDTSGSTAEIEKVTIIRNPTTGTIITSTPTNVDIKVNRNFGSTNILTADAYKGATGHTMTNGDDYLLLFQNSAQ